MALSAAKFRALADKVLSLAPKKTVSYVHVAPGAYDPTSGAGVDVATPHTLQVFEGVLNETEMGWFPAPDKVTKLISSYGTWAAAGITPGRNDYVIIDGAHWEVKRVRTLPTEAATILYVESP